MKGEVSMEPSLKSVDSIQRIVLERLLQFELYELGMEPGADGVIDWGESLDKFFDDPNCIPLFLTGGEAFIGFALIKTSRSLRGPDGVSNGVMNLLAELYILRPWRRKGVGTAAVQRIFRSYPGEWVVTTWPDEARVAFWRSVMSHAPEMSCQEYCPGEHGGFPGQFVWIVKVAQ
jgi:predicted acetyltransferase